MTENSEHIVEKDSRTRTRLRQQRRSMFTTFVVPMALGFILGYLLGFTGQALSAEGLGPGWAWSLIAFGLGGVTALLAQRLWQNRTGRPETIER